MCGREEERVEAVCAVPPEIYWCGYDLESGTERGYADASEEGGRYFSPGCHIRPEYESRETRDGDHPYACVEDRVGRCEEGLNNSENMGRNVPLRSSYLEERSYDPQSVNRDQSLRG